MKIIWVIRDVITIVVLMTGLYLWLRRRRSGLSVERVVVARRMEAHLRQWLECDSSDRPTARPARRPGGAP